MMKHTHISHQKKEDKKRSDSSNHSEPNSMELDCGLLFCGPASDRSQLLPPSHIPPKLLLWSLSQQAHWSHTSNFTLLVPVKTKDKGGTQQNTGSLLPLNFPYFVHGEGQEEFFLSTVFQILVWDSKLQQDCTPSPPPKLSLYFNTEAHPNSLHTGKKSPFHTSPQHRQLDDCTPPGRIQFRLHTSNPHTPCKTMLTIVLHNRNSSFQ